MPLGFSKWGQNSLNIQSSSSSQNGSLKSSLTFDMLRKFKKTIKLDVVVLHFENFECGKKIDSIFDR